MKLKAKDAEHHQTPEGGLERFDVSVAREIAHRLGLSESIRGMAGSRLGDVLQSGQIDVATASMALDKKRDEESGCPLGALLRLADRSPGPRAAAGLRFSCRC